MFTKASWKVEVGYTNIFIIASEGNKHSAVADVPTSNDNAEANAHLIAAAPDLYEALKYIIRELDKADLIKADSIFMEMPNKALSKVDMR